MRVVGARARVDPHVVAHLGGANAIGQGAEREEVGGAQARDVVFAGPARLARREDRGETRGVDGPVDERAHRDPQRRSRSCSTPR